MIIKVSFRLNKRIKVESLIMSLFLMVAMLYGCCISNEAQGQFVEKEITEDGISAYDKLSVGQPLNLLVVGDSIGFGTGSQGIENRWPQLISAHMDEKYGSEVNIENVSMGGCDSVCGYVRVQALNDGTDYDLAVICYGENDAEEDFGLYYESIIRALRAKYPAIEIICIQESSQRDYTFKMQTIAEIAEHYHIPVADLIEPFRADYDNLVVDGTHPNNDGYRIYAKVLEEIIDEQVESAGEAEAGGNKADEFKQIAPFDENVKFFDDFLWIPGSSFKKYGKKLAVTLDQDISGSGVKTSLSSGQGVFLLADINDYPGENSLRILNNSTEVATRSLTWPNEFAQRHIPVVAKDVTLESGTLTIEFNSKKQADDFEGIGIIGNR